MKHATSINQGGMSKPQSQNIEELNDGGNDANLNESLLSEKKGNTMKKNEETNIKQFKRYRDFREKENLVDLTSKDSFEEEYEEELSGCCVDTSYLDELCEITSEEDLQEYQSQLEELMGQCSSAIIHIEGFCEEISERELEKEKQLKREFNKLKTIFN